MYLKKWGATVNEDEEVIEVETIQLPLLTPDKFEAMIKAINEGKKLTVEVAMSNYTINPEHLTALKTALKNN